MFLNSSSHASCASSTIQGKNVLLEHRTKSDPHLERDEENASSDGSETEPFLLARRHDKRKSEGEFSLSSSRCSTVDSSLLCALYVDCMAFALANTAEVKLLGLSEKCQEL